ncbi:MAG: TMEM43 family protein [Leptospirales bacterium]|nr:TMEM43 family protein [Leptospirales bacterium]
MADYSTTTTVSWGERLKQSITTTLVGAGLFLAAFPVLWYNERCSVDNIRGLEAYAQELRSVDANSVSGADEGKPVHLSGQAVTTETLHDDLFGVSRVAIRIERDVEMYQWKETEEKKTQNNTGGSQTTTTTYKYTTEWSSSYHDSSRFKERSGHSNPSMPAHSQTFTANNVTIGARRFSAQMISQIGGSQELVPDNAGGMSLAGRSGQAEGGYIYFSQGSPGSPQVGDVRVKFSYVPSDQTVTIFARQTGNSFAGLPREHGTDILRVDMGQLSKEQVIEAQASSDKVMRWILRIGGFAAMWIGLALFFRPLRVLADVLPFLGSLLGAGLTIFSGIISVVLSFSTIAIAWIFYRPLLGLGLLAVVAGAIALAVFIVKKRKAAAQSA